LQDHDHQNDNDKDADNDANDSTVHFSSFRFAAEVTLVTRSRCVRTAVLVNTFHRGEPRFVVANTGPYRSGAMDRPRFSGSKSPESHRMRVRDLAVTAEAIMTRTAATAMAMSHRTQSMPGLPSPPSAV
jgi:hypothetical protein